MPTEVERWREIDETTREVLPNGYKCSFKNCLEDPYDTEIEALACERYHMALEIERLKKSERLADRLTAARMTTLVARLDAARPDVLALIRRRNCDHMLANLVGLIDRAAELGYDFPEREKVDIDLALAVIQKGLDADPTLGAGEPLKAYKSVEPRLREIVRLFESPTLDDEAPAS